MKHRQLRVNELVKRELSGIIAREINFEGALVSINAVDVAPDLKSAQVFVSTLGAGNGKSVIDKLEAFRPALQAALSRHVVLKYTPTLKFVADDSVVRGTVQLENAKRAPAVCETKMEAVDRARELTKVAPLGQVIIQRKDDFIQEESASVGGFKETAAFGSSELLGSPRMKELVDDMKTRYPDRFIFFDVPPVLCAADALAFAPLVDHILVVVRAGSTSIQDVQKSLQLLPKEKIIGLVLNRQNFTADPYGLYFTKK